MHSWLRPSSASPQAYHAAWRMCLQRLLAPNTYIRGLHHILLAHAHAQIIHACMHACMGRSQLHYLPHTQLLYDLPTTSRSVYTHTCKRPQPCHGLSPVSCIGSLPCAPPSAADERRVRGPQRRLRGVCGASDHDGVAPHQDAQGDAGGHPDRLRLDRLGVPRIQGKAVGMRRERMGMINQSGISGAAPWAPGRCVWACVGVGGVGACCVW